MNCRTSGSATSCSVWFLLFGSGSATPDELKYHTHSRGATPGQQRILGERRQTQRQAELPERAERKTEQARRNQLNHEGFPRIAHLQLHPFPPSAKICSPRTVFAAIYTSPKRERGRRAMIFQGFLANASG